jgi:hypothetical protein
MFGLLLFFGSWCVGPALGFGRVAVSEPAAAGLGLYPIVTFQYSSTTLYQFSYHIR